jgi:hypothetical protein
MSQIRWGGVTVKALPLHSAVMLKKSFFQNNEHYLVTDNKKSNRISVRIPIACKKTNASFLIFFSFT